MNNFNFNKPSPRSGLTASDILDIRRLHDEEDYNDARLSRLFSVSRKTVYNIVNRKTWADVPQPSRARGFKNYTVYPDGRIYSEISGEFLTHIKRMSGSVVRLTNNGVRHTVPVASLIQKTFGKSIKVA